MLHVSSKISVYALLALASAVLAVGPTDTTKHGPRLSDNEMLDSLDPNVPALSRVIALRDRGDVTSALSALAAFIRAGGEPAGFGQRAKRNPQADTSYAEKVLDHRFVVVGIPYTFGRDIDWGFNPTTTPDSKYDRSPRLSTNAVRQTASAS
jgi:hypothetical protein